MNTRGSSVREISLGMRILDSGKHVWHPLLPLIRKRSLVRVQAGPLLKSQVLQQEHKPKPRTVKRAGDLVQQRDKNRFLGLKTAALRSLEVCCVDRKA